MVANRCIQVMQLCVERILRCVRLLSLTFGEWNVEKEECLAKARKNHRFERMPEIGVSLVRVDWVGNRVKPVSCECGVFEGTDWRKVGFWGELAKECGSLLSAVANFEALCDFASEALSRRFVPINLSPPHVVVRLFPHHHRHCVLLHSTLPYSSFQCIVLKSGNLVVWLFSVTNRLSLAIRWCILVCWSHIVCVTRNERWGWLGQRISCKLNLFIEGSFWWLSDLNLCCSHSHETGTARDIEDKK